MDSVERRLFQKMDTEMTDNEVEALRKAKFWLEVQLTECKLQLERKEFETKRLEREIEWLKEQSKRDSEYYKEQIEWWRKYRVG